MREAQSHFLNSNHLQGSKRKSLLISQQKAKSVFYSRWNRIITFVRFCLTRRVSVIFACKRTLVSCMKSRDLFSHIRLRANSMKKPNFLFWISVLRALATNISDLHSPTTYKKNPSAIFALLQILKFPFNQDVGLPLT